MNANLQPDIPQTSRFWSLDIIKGISILAIIAFHVLPANSEPSLIDSSITWINWLRYGGTLGVSIFFVLSGFGIHYSQAKKLINDAEFQPIWSKFIFRRLQRLYPAYLGAILLSLVINSAWGLIRQQNIFAYLPPIWDIIAHLLFLHTLSPKTFFGIIPALWFVGTLVQLYLLYPIFYKLAQLWGINRALLVVILFTLISRLISQYFTDDLIDQDLRSVLWFNSPQRWFEWCMGAWVAQKVAQKNYFPVNYISLYCLLVLIWLPLGSSGNLVYEPVLGCLIGLMIWSLVIKEINISYSWWSIIFLLGKLSYPVYLLHQIFIPYIRSALTPSPFNTFSTFFLLLFLVLMVTVPISLIFNHFLEIPPTNTKPKYDSRN
ncbi:acyltransferase family protein [Anabaena sp. CS-542/02]|uniref:acyltransferase family protein n=1 Tax=Anabaena sp. CS-542/02 TaxID=3021719 RepID=UPI00232E4500|nr:acyltransferase [Anabaena sp. CS-542/02]MDB9446466.1 acyltransferase [Anabaena sp. CS-542/02]